MTKQEETLFHEEKLAMRKYAKERRKISDDLHTYMKLIFCRDKMVGGFIIGLLLGTVLGGINLGIGALKIKTLNRKDLIKTNIQHKLLQKKLVFSTMTIVTVVMLIILSCCLEDCREVSEQDFQGIAKKLAKGYFKQIFEQEHCTKEMATRAKHAAALIINNMPKETLDYMRVLAIAGLSYDSDGYFEIHKTAINDAQEILSEHLDAHPEIRNAVAQIMNNEKIQTYVLNGISQKTK